MGISQRANVANKHMKRYTISHPQEIGKKLKLDNTKCQQVCGEMRVLIDTAGVINQCDNFRKQFGNL